MSQPILTEADKRAYTQRCHHQIDWVQVKHDDLHKPWCVTHSAQIEGHSEHYSSPIVGQWIPYNVVTLAGRTLPAPYTILSSGSYYRTKTMT